MASLTSQIKSLKEQNKCMQKKVEFANGKGDNCEANGAADGHEKGEPKTGLRVSELLLSDNLIHEENAKVIAELKEAGEKREAENRQLKKKLEEVQKQNETLEKNAKSAQAQIQILKSENKQH